MKNKNKLKAIERLWPTPEDMEKDIEVDFENQTIKNKKNDRFMKPFITGSRKRNNCYLTIRFERNNTRYNIKVHLIFFYAKHRYIPTQIDHIDKNKFNNNINNLREANASLNGLNRTKFNRKGKETSSRHKSVFRRKNGKWMAMPKRNYKPYYLGLFDLEDEAGEAVNQFYIRNNLTDFAVMNDTPQERARKLNLFNEEKLSYS